MRDGEKSWQTTVWCLTFLMILGLAGAVRAESVILQVVPPVVEIGAFYHGREVTITGTLPAGYQAVAEVVGPVGQEHLMRKGRRGPLWMNVGEVTVSGAPSLYLVLSSAADLLAEASPWGFQSLKKDLTLAGQVQEKEKGEFLEQFLELKKSEKLYAVLPGGLKLTPAGDGRLEVTGRFWVPANVKPDTYKVCLTAVLEGKAVDRQCTALSVQMIGFPALLMSLAYQHALIYGILAVVIAIFTGFIMGYLFKGGGGH
jgi:hypothetical protein